MKPSILYHAAAILLCAMSAKAAPSAATAVKYLQHFGYMRVPDPRLGEILSENEMMESIKVFQRFTGLPQTGILDLETLDKMEQKRCGNPDVMGTEYAARKKRYALQGSKWYKKHLTYAIETKTDDLSRRDTEKAIADAFKEWEAESGLTFEHTRAAKNADIKIKFAEGAHGDGDPFDGPSQTLAHAFFPQFGGDAHFDEAETWVIGNTRGVSLFIVAAHEFGHSLGLSHSDVQGALMAPMYNPNYKGLHEDDIKAIQTLYGEPSEREKPSVTTTTRPRRPTKKPVNPGPTLRTTTTKTPPVGACNGRFDAVTRVHNGSTFAFKDDHFWRLNDQGMDKNYPQKIIDGWGFSGGVDASLTYQGYTDFFQGKHVRRFVNGVPVRGYPKPISEVYPGMPTHIDTAYVWSGNGRIYFMKGSKYWRFNPSTRKADQGYPRPLSVWKGLPDSIDAALQWKDKTYFFKSGFYWRFDDEKIEVAQSLKAPYPRRSDEWWLGCADNTLKSTFEENRDKDEEDDDGNGAGSKLNAGMVQVMTPTILVLILSNFFS